MTAAMFGRLDKEKKFHIYSLIVIVKNVKRHRTFLVIHANEVTIVPDAVSKLFLVTLMILISDV